MAAEFHSTDQVDGDTDGDLYFCEPCDQYVHYTFTSDNKNNFALIKHRDHYLYPVDAAKALQS